MIRLAIIVVLSASSLLAACASAGSMGDTVGGSLQQPLRDLNVMRDTPVVALVQARAAPYRPPAEPVCSSIGAELALLDAALGPDSTPPARARRTTSAQSWSETPSATWSACPTGGSSAV